MSMTWNPDFWMRPEAEVVQDLVNQGYPPDVALAMVRATQNAVTGEVEEGWTRVEAPGAGTPEDPSPNSLAEGEAPGGGEGEGDGGDDGV